MKTTIFRHPGKLLLAAIVIAMIAVTADKASAAVTDSFTATYKVNYGFIGLGELTFKLRPAKSSGCYIYSGQGHPNAIVSMLVGELSDESRFCITDNNIIQPHYFRHHEEGDPEDSYTLNFDWDNGTVRYQNRDGNIRVMSLPDTATDPLSLQVAARLWLASSEKPAELPNRHFTLVDENEIKTYTLAVEPGGTTVVPAGRFETLVVERVDDKEETLRFWLAAYADWIPVKVEHEQDGRVITMTLTSLEREQASTR